MPIRTFVILVLALAALAGCGRRGALEHPGKPETKAVPSPEVGIAPTIAARPGTVETPRAAPLSAPERRFILDPLI